MYRKDCPQTIQTMFNSIAKRYDLTNAVLSLSLHKKWNRALVNLMLKNHPHTLVDLCAGTGDIAIDFLNTTKNPCHAYFVDFSEAMLEHAKMKASKLPFNQHELSFLEADVQQLPLPDQSADCATMAYGIRNVQHPSRCIKDVYRVLKPGGRFGILELTRPRSQILRFGHQLYLRTFLPLLGKWLTANQDAYQYLRNSINTFIAPEEIENLMKKEGFIQTQKYSLAGGIATILVGQKPHS